MKKWAKIDRTTGNVVKYKRSKELKRVLNKKYVWVEEVEGKRPPSLIASTVDPIANTNSTLGRVWVNKTSGNTFVCTDAKKDANVWKQQTEEEGRNSIKSMYDPNTQQIRPKPTLPDLSDLSKPVDASVQRVINYEIVNFSDQQIKEQTILKIVETDKRMARITEDLLSILVCKGDVKWTDLKEEVQEVINDRRTKRGKADLSASSALTFQDPYA